MGMMVSIETEGATFPDVGKVMSIDLGRDNPVEVQWCDLERASHKPKWLRFFIPGKTITIL